MTIYYNSRTDSGLRSIEFVPTPSGNLAFITLGEAGDRDALLQWLKSREIGQKLTVETTVSSHPVLVMRGALSKEELLQKLAARGESLAPLAEKKSINWWSVRGMMGIAGQLLQLSSAFIRVEEIDAKHPKLNPENAHFNPKLRKGMWVRKSFDPSLGMFAILNLTANFGNMMYGGQKEEDIHRLRHVKNLVNDQLAPHLKPGEQPLDIDDNRKEHRTESAAPLTPLQQFNRFAKHNSVRFFELGLRSVAAAALVIPFDLKKLREGAGLLAKGKPAQAFEVARHKNKWVMMAGFGYLTGKVIAWFSKVPDPYNPKPHTWLDTVREKLLFPIGSVIELAAGVAIATSAFRSTKIGFFHPHSPDIKPHRDWLGTVGGGLFAGAYAIRLGAHFGSKDVDIDEIIAHSSDMLAKAPPQKVPQLMADTAATLTEHFSDKKLSYGTVYQRLLADWQKYHGAPRPANQAITKSAEHIASEKNRDSNVLSDDGAPASAPQIPTRIIAGGDRIPLGSASPAPDRLAI